MSFYNRANLSRFFATVLNPTCWLTTVRSFWRIVVARITNKPSSTYFAGSCLDVKPPPSNSTSKRPMMDKSPKTMQDQLADLYPDAATRVAQTDPKSIISVSVEKDTVIVRKVGQNSQVVNEAQLYHLISNVLTVEGTDSLWHVRTPSRSMRGGLLILHNPKVFQVLVDPLAICRNGMSEFNYRGKITLHCYPSRRDYCAPKESHGSSPQGRIQPAVVLNDDKDAPPSTDIQEAHPKEIPAQQDEK